MLALITISLTRWGLCIAIIKLHQPSSRRQMDFLIRIILIPRCTCSSKPSLWLALRWVSVCKRSTGFFCSCTFSRATRTRCHHRLFYALLYCLIKLICYWIHPSLQAVYACAHGVEYRASQFLLLHWWLLYLCRPIVPVLQLVLFLHNALLNIPKTIIITRTIIFKKCLFLLHEIS